MGEYYDRDGKPLSLIEWSSKFEDNDYKRVAIDELPGDVRVSTVWLGLDHGWNGERQIFETMVSGGDQDENQWRYATEQEAKDGHAKIVAELEGTP